MNEGDAYALKSLRFTYDDGFDYPMGQQSLENIHDGIEASGLKKILLME